MSTNTFSNMSPVELRLEAYNRFISFERYPPIELSRTFLRTIDNIDYLTSEQLETLWWKAKELTNNFNPNSEEIIQPDEITTILLKLIQNIHKFPENIMEEISFTAKTMFEKYKVNSAGIYKVDLLLLGKQLGENKHMLKIFAKHAGIDPDLPATWLKELLDL